MSTTKRLRDLRWILLTFALGVGGLACSGSSANEGTADAGSDTRGVTDGGGTSDARDTGVIKPRDAGRDAEDADGSAKDGAMPMSSLTDFQPFGEGGMVECNAGGASGPLCAWSTTQKSPSPFTGNNEIVACPVSYSSGSPQCTSAPTCLTCDQMFRYSTSTQKGQPRWFPDGVHLAFWVSDPMLSTGATCSRVSPGSGCNGDLWIGTVAGTTTLSLDATSLIKWTDEGQGGGVLFNTINANYIAYSERFGDGDGSAPQRLGCWHIRVFDYEISAGAVVMGSEISGSPFNPVGSCVWMEDSGFFDPVTGQLVVTANAPTSPWWQPQLYAINLTSGESNTFVDWATTQTGCPWNEHVHIDPTGKYVTWSSAQGNDGFGGYNGCSTTFPGNPPLDLYRADLVRVGSGTSATITADEKHATRLSMLNVLGSADREAACGWLGTCSDSTSKPTSFSGGQGNWPESNFYIWLIKDVSGRSAIVSRPMSP
jgi:hypothetical protein